MKRFFILLISLILFLGPVAASEARGVYVRSGSYYRPYYRGYNYRYRPYYPAYYAPYPYYAPTYYPAYGGPWYGAGYYPYGGVSVFYSSPGFGFGAWY